MQQFYIIFKIAQPTKQDVIQPAIFFIIYLRLLSKHQDMIIFNRNETDDLSYIFGVPEKKLYLTCMHTDKVPGVIFMFVKFVSKVFSYKLNFKRFYKNVS